MSTPKKSGGLFWVGVAALAVLLVMAGLILYGLVSQSQTPINIVGKASDTLASRWGVSIFLVKGLVIIVSIPFFWAWSKLVPATWSGLFNMSAPSLDPFFYFRSWPGWIVVGYVGVFYLAEGFASRDAMAYKNCADTPEGIYATDNTGVDPHYGRPLKPCTTEQIVSLRHPHAPRELSAADVRQRGFFNIGGYPQIWYATGEDGTYRFFDRGGVDSNGDALAPVTHAVVASWTRQQREAAAQQQSERKARAQQQLHAQTEQQMAAAATQAQAEYSSGNLEAALASCKPVLAAEPTNASCREIDHDAGSKLARQLVDRGEGELQRGELEDAARNADRALELDPANGAARTLRTVATNLRAASNQ